MSGLTGPLGLLLLFKLFLLCETWSRIKEYFIKKRFIQKYVHLLSSYPHSSCSRPGVDMKTKISATRNKNSCGHPAACTTLDLLSPIFGKEVNWDQFEKN